MEIAAAKDINTGLSVIPKEMPENYEDGENIENNNGNVNDVTL